MKITKHKETYVVEKDHDQLVKIKTYRNPYHLNHCYVDFELDNIEVFDEKAIFQRIADEEKRPLQAMLSSKETQKVNFLASQGFNKVRMCYEMEVEKKDLLLVLPNQGIKLSKTNRGQDDYNDCCRLLFNYYKEVHEFINPLSASFELFIEELPNEIFYVRGDNDIKHVAFIEDNEIAYVSSSDELTFECFALTVVNELFSTHQSIVFEADNVDWAAMAVKNLFLTDTTETFDTWIYK